MLRDFVVVLSLLLLRYQGDRWGLGARISVEIVISVRMARDRNVPRGAYIVSSRLPPEISDLHFNPIMINNNNNIAAAIGKSE